MIIHKVMLIIITLVILGVVLLLDNLYFTGIAFELNDIHHETWILVAFGVAAFLFVLKTKRII